jgi:SAM-dependent methyltransferase
MSDAVPYNTTRLVGEPFVSSAEFYDAIYAARGKDYAAETAYLIGVASRAVARPLATLLDVACGTGEHLAHFREYLTVSGFDGCPAMLAVARRKLPDVELIEGDVMRMTLGRRFDVITCLFASVAYLPDVISMTRAVAIMAEHLEPGGVLLIEPGVLRGQAEPPRDDSMTVSYLDSTLTRRTSGRLSPDRLEITFEYEFVAEGGRQSFTESHVVQLFARDAYERAMAEAGLACEFDARGPAGRGLFIGRSPG